MNMTKEKKEQLLNLLGLLRTEMELGFDCEFFSFDEVDNLYIRIKKGSYAFDPQELDPIINTALSLLSESEYRKCCRLLGISI